MTGSPKKKRVGVLALQGDFEAHERALRRAGAEAVEVRSAADLEGVEGLVIPGGESTTMMKLLEEEKLFEPLREFGRQRPIFGTCAGAILLASHVVNSPQASVANPTQGSLANPPRGSLGLMDMEVERNAYGRQLDSRIARLHVAASRFHAAASKDEGEGESRSAREGESGSAREGESRSDHVQGDLEAVFIRAPIIRRVGQDANVLASYQGDPVLVEQGRHLAATFHPELTEDSRVHLMFLRKIP